LEHKKIKYLGTSLVVQQLKQPSNAEGVGSIPGQGAEIPHASQPKNIKKKRKEKQKQYCNKFNKDFKNGPHQKKSLKMKYFHLSH